MCARGCIDGNLFDRVGTTKSVRLTSNTFSTYYPLPLKVVLLGGDALRAGGDQRVLLLLRRQSGFAIMAGVARGT